MNKKKQDALLDLLTKKVTCGLDEAEQRQLEDIHAATEEREFRSLEITAAAIAVAGTPADELLPAHLYSKILEDADQYLGDAQAKASSPWPPAKPQADPGYDTILSPRDIGSGPARSWFEWLGWAAAAAACIILAINIWVTRTPKADQANIKPSDDSTNVLKAQLREQSNKAPTQSPQTLAPSQMREEMLRSNIEMVKANWTAGNVKEMKVSGDVIWSDEKQKGYIRLNGLPMNDGTKETYQLWISDKNQDKATPIDGGTFDVTSDGEIVIPINAKLKAKGAEMFTITIEKAGGVVVSKREKIAATAKVETPAS